MGKKHAIEHFDVVALTARHHGGNKISRSVVAEACGLLPRRAVVGAGNVSDMMFEVMLLKTELCGIDVEGLQQKRAHIAHSLFALAEANEVQDLGRVGERVLNLLCEIRVAVLADGHMLDIGNLRPDRIQTGLDRESGKSAEVFMAGWAVRRHSGLQLSLDPTPPAGAGAQHIVCHNKYCTPV